MAKQNVELGTAPTGAGGDTFRSGSVKFQANDNELYAQLGANAQGVLPAGLPIDKGGTGATTAAGARTNLGLTITTSQIDTTVGRVTRVGDFGLGGKSISRGSGGNPINTATWEELSVCQMVTNGNDGGVAYGSGLMFPSGSSPAVNRVHGIVGGFTNSNLYHACITNSAATTVADRGITRSLIRTAANTTVDANGFIKNASPIVKLFADHIELNDEAQLQEITFEKLGVGDYLIKDSSGFAQEGWYVETPKDANGNVLFSVIYSTLENGDTSVQTYKKKFDLETASIVADLTKPVDISDGRWIDIRLQELPQPEIDPEDLVFESATPPDFQPTNLAQAVAEAFNNGTEQ